MPIESIRDVDLQAQGVSFRERKAFNNRKILAEVVITADVAKGQGQISKGVTALRHKAVGILVQERSTVEVIVAWIQGGKGSVRGVFLATGWQVRIEG